ncbi:MAG: sugar transferase [Clostridia bacterium]|nr:sugar transferase [Clostridia bacterium]
MYRHFVKPLLDILTSFLAIVVLLPFFILFTPIVAMAMKGNPFFIQKRPGKNGKIFKMIKYRTMTNAKDKEGNMLPDDERLTKFGKIMRSLSIDELPELFNIFMGQMSVVGPRPQLVRDLVFMDEQQIKRQSICPGLTGWAQVNGRNNVTWEDKLNLDLFYLKKQSILLDVKILFMTVFKVFVKKDINTQGMETAEDFGDYLLRTGKIEDIYYYKMHNYADILMSRKRYNVDIIQSIQKTIDIDVEDYSKYSVLMTVYRNTVLEYLKESLESMLNQTIEPEQVVIVFDGPVPNDVRDYLYSHRETKPDLFTIVELEENKGQGLAARAGMEYCRNQLIARMDDDDVSKLDRMEKQLNFLDKNRDIDVLGGNIAEFIGDTTNIVGKRVVEQRHNDILKYQRSRCPFNQQTIVFKKSKVEQAGGYKDWHFNEDSYLWARMTLVGCMFANLSETLVCFRINDAVYKRRGGIKYYQSEKKFFKFMYRNRIISLLDYQKAKLVRFVVQVLMTNKIRQWFFKTFARSK